MRVSRALAGETASTKYFDAKLKRMKQVWLKLKRWLWELRQLVRVGLPDFRIGAGESLPHRRKVKSIRVAPASDGKPIASFWNFWAQGDEIYAAGRNHVGIHKLSFHSSGKWYSTLTNDRRELAAAHVLPGGQWLHAVELRFLVGEAVLPPLPEKPFREADAGFMMELPTDEYLVVHLLIGARGTSHDHPLPEGFHWPKLLELVLRDGTCAVVIGAHFKMPEQARLDVLHARSIRLQSTTPPNLKRLRMEVFQVEITSEGYNRVTVIPLGPEAITTEPLTGGRRVPWEVIKPN